MAEILRAKPVVTALQADIEHRIAELGRQGVVPKLAVVRVGEISGGVAYERGVLNRAKKYGVEAYSERFSADLTQEGLLEEVARINEDTSIHGCLLLRPLPAHLNEIEACDALAISKDIDGVGHGSLAAAFTGRGPGFAPCTPEACVRMLDAYGIDMAGKHVVVVGRSLVVGRPLAMLLLARDATVTICHSRTVDLASMTRQADIVVLAAGQAHGFGKEYFRAGQVVIDVGVSMGEGGQMYGDADFDEVEPIVAAISPVPMGVGSITSALLIEHVVRAAEMATCER